MTPGAPDYFKSILLHGTDEAGDTVAALVDKEGRFIFRSVTEVESAMQGSSPTISAGLYTIDSDVVPSGERWIVSSIACMNLNTMNTSVQIYVYDGDTFRILKSQNSPAEMETTDWQGALVMETGWYIYFVFRDCAQDDTLLWGITYTIVED